MPLEWKDDFDWHWHGLRADCDKSDDEKNVRAHIDELRKTLTRGGRLRRALGKSLEIRRPTEWHPVEARRILGWDPETELPQNLTRHLRETVVQAVLSHVEATVGRRLTPAFPLAQLRRIGIPPRLRPIEHSGIQWADALQALAEWTIAGVTPFIRSASGRLEPAPGRNGVQEILAHRFRGGSATQAYEAAVHWESIACEEIDVMGGISQALVEAWRSFQAWFDFTAETIRWEDHAPSWSTLVRLSDGLPVGYEPSAVFRVVAKTNPFSRRDQEYAFATDLLRGAPKRLKMSQIRTLLRRHWDFGSSLDAEKQVVCVVEELQKHGLVEFLGIPSKGKPSRSGEGAWV